jgi:hypothetical protein
MRETGLKGRKAKKKMQKNTCEAMKLAARTVGTIYLVRFVADHKTIH